MLETEVASLPIKTGSTQRFNGKTSMIERKVMFMLHVTHISKMIITVRKYEYMLQLSRSVSYIVPSVF